MNIKFEKLHIENFLSFLSADVELSSQGFVVVSGVNSNKSDSAKSNGSGKSAIWEAISWGLTGETIRGVKDVKNLYGEDGAVVELKFSVDSTTYELTRSKDHSKLKTNLRILVNGEDKSGKGIRESEKLLESYLPDVTPNLIGSVILLGQGMPSRLSNNTPAGRKEILERLSKSDFMIADLKDRVDKRKIELKTIETQLLLDDHKLNIEIDNCNQTISTSKQKLASLLESESNFSEIDSIKESIVEAQRTLCDIKSQIETYDVSLREYADKNREEISYLNDALMEKMKVNSDKRYKIQKRIDEITNEMDSIIKQVEEINNIQTICPTCGRPFEGVEKPSTKELEGNLLELDKQRQLVKTSLDDMTKVCNDEEKQCRFEIRNIESEFNNTVSSIKAKIKVLQDEEHDVFMMITSLQSKLSGLEVAQKVNDSLKKELFETISDNESKVSDLEQKIMYNNIELQKISTKLSINTKMDTVLKRDFRGILLYNVIDYISKKSKHYSQEVFGTDKIDFELNGNNLNILYCGKQYENLSGGEKQKIDIIIQLSLRDMLCKFQNFSSNIIVFDEIFDNLDDVGTQKILNLITNNIVDADSIYIITHHTDISIPFDKEIIVIKNNDGISYIQ
jgi:DNA repair exonuclease SbcCD ATPase subunit